MINKFQEGANSGKQTHIAKSATDKSWQKWIVNCMNCQRYSQLYENDYSDLEFKLELTIRHFSKVM